MSFLTSIIFYIVNVYSMPVKSFWESDNKIPIGQSSIVVQSENNLDHTAGQKVRFHIPGGTEFINPKETYFRCDVDIAISAGAKTNLQLDADIGGQVLIRDIRVMTKSGTLLEEIQGYNTLVACMYDYDTNQNMKGKRGLTEGSTTYNPLVGGTKGCLKLNQNDCLTNPYFKRETSTNTSDTATAFKTAKMLLPLHTGIFQNDKVFPTMLTDGLVVEMVLEENARVFRQLDTVNKYRNVANNPHFLNLTGADGLETGVGNGSDVETFYINASTNSMNSLENFPFRVGESFKWVDVSTFEVSASGNITREDISSASGVSGGHFVIEELEQTVGTGSNQKVKVTVASGSLSGSDLSANSVMWSTACEYTTDLVASYTLSNLELVVQQLDMPDGYKSSLMRSMKSGGTMMYDFLSYTNYRFSTLASESVINLRLPLQNSRAKSILCVPTDATTRSLPANTGAVDTYFQFEDEVVEGSALWSDRVGLEGCVDFLQNYQFLYDNRLQPNRKVEMAKTGDKVSISQQGLIELEKGLAMADIDVRSFRKYNRNFVIGRALALGDGVYDTRGKDFNLQLEYTGSVPQQVNKLWNCYCAHIRGLQISGENISVML